ncbi:hypothetical protein [Microbispora siamensis]|uniref:Secreted protein n=1 Tax=Microbispora siamensis TaxID=564413 RepID=A0ABQ4GNE0_9ACTN|nr:hypothetical protein [Microbispora siamensis]GIH62942.1 hypothetical protein Msi02_37590 [Microbispora siamensis]
MTRRRSCLLTAVVVAGIGAGLAAFPATANADGIDTSPVRPDAPQSSDRLAELEVLKRPAPAPRPIAPEDLPLNEKDKASASLQRSSEAVSAVAAADVWCGSWLSDPGAVELQSVNSPLDLDGVYYYPNSWGPFKWQNNDGIAPDGKRYAWTKMYETVMGEFYNYPDKRVTTGWWDNSNNPHFCGWGSNLYRNVYSTNEAYSAGIRKDQATFVRAHGYVYDSGWLYTSHKTAY